MLLTKRLKLKAIVVCLVLAVTSVFFAAALARVERVNAAGGTEVTVTTETELRNFRDDTDTAIIYVDADSLIMTSYIRINYGPKVIMPAEGRERVTLACQRYRHTVRAV